MQSRPENEDRNNDGRHNLRHGPGLDVLQPGLEAGEGQGRRCHGALRATVHLPKSARPPCWLRRDDEGALYGTDADPVIACANGLLEVRTRQLRLLTPAFFNLVATPYAFAADAPQPARWLNFLHELWPDDIEAIAALRQWFGYVLSGDTSQQKIMLLVGAIRAASHCPSAAGAHWCGTRCQSDACVLGQ
jgi:hypothetical protein